MFMVCSLQPTQECMPLGEWTASEGYAENRVICKKGILLLRHGTLMRRLATG
jgi:hypothetical protein